MSQLSADAHARQRALDNIQRLGLASALVDLDVHGFAVLRAQLTSRQIEQAKAGIIARVERTAQRKVNLEEESGEGFKGMQYVPYMLYEDPVYEDILMNEKPLALVTWLLGESCLLSSMGCHFRGPGGAPLMLHCDNGNGMPAPYSNIAMTANVNYALTPYSRAAGALGLVPGSHKLCRQPTAHENFRAANLSGAELVAKQRSDAGVDDVQWRDPPGFVGMDLRPGDAVIWHGNTWHGGYRRDIPGMRMNLAVFFNRQFVQTQERHRGVTPEHVLERHANDERFKVLLAGKQPYGWQSEGPDYAVMGRAPVGQFD